MRTTINRFFLLGLLACVVLLAAAVHGLHAFQISRQSSFLLDQAHRALKEKQFGPAVNYFQQYTKLAPQDVDAQAEFGLLLADLGASRDAALTLERVLRAQPDRDDLRRRLVPVEMGIDRVSDAKAHVERLLARLPDDAALWDLLGNCQAAGGEYVPAVGSLEKSIGHDPHQVGAYAHLAEVLRRLKRPDEADKWMAKLVQANPESARAHLLDGQYLAGIGREKEAQGQTEKVLELSPKETGALLLAARLTSDKPPYDKARGYAQRAIDSAPTSPAGYIILARIEATAGDRKQAIACLETGAAATQSRDRALLWELGRLRIAAGDLPGTQGIVDTLHKLPADDRFEPLIGYLEAEIELANHHWLAAAQRFQQIVPQLSRLLDLQEEVVQLQIAACQEKLGNTELQLAAYRDAARANPSWPPARLGIASVLLAKGRFDEALEEYRQIAKLDGMQGAGAAGVARLLILKNLARRPAEQDWTEVDSLLDQLGHNNPDSVGVTLLRAEALAGEQHPAEAEQLLLAARTKAPDRTELWTALVGLADLQQEWPKAEQLLAEAEKRFGDQVWLRLARGASLLAHDKQESAAKLKALGDQSAAFSPADQATLSHGLSTLSLEAGDVAQATVLAHRACDADPKDLESRLFLFNLSFRSGDAVALRQVLKEIRGLEGEGPVWHFGQAALCLLAKPSTAKGDEVALDEAAFEHISAARKLRPGWSALSLLTAQILDRQGQSGAALQNYLEAIDLGERSPVAVRRAVELLYAKQRYAEADQLLRRLDQQPGLFSGNIERMASKVSARLEDLDRALDLARKVAANSHDWQDQVWLGQLQSLVGLRAKGAGRVDEAASRFAEAEKSLKQAVQLKPEAPEPWVALVRFYVAIDRKADAETAIQQAKRKLPAETAALTLASSYEAIGDMNEAAEQYQAALAAAPQNAQIVRSGAEFEMRTGKLADAEAQLRKIVSGQVAAKPEEVAAARRELAAVLRASGRYSKIQQALALIEQNLAAGVSPEDLREKSFALALCPQPERRQMAIEILEKLLQAQPDADNLRIALAQLYLAAKDWPRASTLLRNLVTSHEKDPRSMALYLTQLLQHDEADEAELWIRRLEQIAPNEFATASLKAELLVKHGQVDAAIQTLRDALARQELPPAEATKKALLVAARLEELSRGATGPDRSPAADKLLAEAESMYRKSVGEQPEQQLALAGFLARRGRFDESLSLLEATGTKADPNSLAQAIVELVESDPAVAPSAPRSPLENLLLAAVDRTDHAPALLIALADLRIRQERFDDAIKTYREVLKKDASNVVSMNNLAMLLALEKKQLDEALQLVDQAIAAAGPLPALLDSRASVYLALGKPQQALTDLEQALSAEPRPNREFHRALACYQLGQTQAAAQALHEARKKGLKPENLNPMERPAYQELAAKLQGQQG
ncbi:MAG TPA: tetratricopeptide repeat protein [Pirellulales bacterium]|jgi:tetratricopeptide (TPR) repeat protein|nr:tetratricopeptide repeat protein [Pirellulales bacterium]